MKTNQKKTRTKLGTQGTHEEQGTGAGAQTKKPDTPTKIVGTRLKYKLN